jgi:hypothetical protein
MRVRVDTSDENLPPLRAGMSVEADVDTGHARGIPHFLDVTLGSIAPFFSPPRISEEQSSGHRIPSTWHVEKKQ